MKGRNWILTGVLLLTVALAVVAPVNSQRAEAQESLARVRFLHAVPGAPEVDVYVNGQVVAVGLGYGDVTPHFRVPPGDYQVTLRQTGTGADAPTLLEVPVPLKSDFLADPAFTVVVQGTPDAIGAALYEDILDTIAVGLARLMVINAVSDAPAVDLLNKDSGGPLLQGVSYGKLFGTVNIPASVQNLILIPAGGSVDGALADVGQVALDTGKLYTVVAMGTIADGVTTTVLETPVKGDADTALVQFGHGSADAPAVDVYLDDMLVSPSLDLGELTGHIAVPSGTYMVAVRNAGAAAAEEPVASVEVTLDAAPQTIVATGLVADGSLALMAFADEPAAVPANQAALSVVNTVPDAQVSVELNDAAATQLASALATGDHSMGMEVTPGEYMLMVSIEGEGNPVELVIPSADYYGGAFYSVLVYGGGAAPYNAMVSGTEIATGLDSAPVPAQPVAMAVEPTAEPVVEPTAEPLALATAEPVVEPTADNGALLPLATEAPMVIPPTDAPAVAVQPTVAPLPTEAPAGNTELVIQPTAASSSEVVSPPVQPGQPAAGPLPIAYVELDPGANLHCRELPASDKKSLALIPSGTTLTVIGRTGTPLVPETGAATPEPTPVVEDIEQLWLAVRWEPAGGGYVNCWVAAQFLRVEFRGKLLDELEELWALPEEPFNRPGEVVGADVAPPTPLFDAVLATVELEPGVSLQLRRYPETDAESLELVPAQAQLEVLGYAEAPSSGLVGQPTDPVWLYVRYRTENGGATIGWVSAQYVSLSRLGRDVDMTDLVIVDVGEAGYYELPGEAPDIPLELQDVIAVVNLNPGANLNLRDRPTADARVVVGIPSGDTMVVNGRNGDGSWVQVTYESAAGDLEGWVASQYLLFTRGGQEYDIKGLSIVNGETDTME